MPKTDIRPHWRDFHTASVFHDSSHDSASIYIFGGRMDKGGMRYTGESFYSNDMYAFNVKTRKWTLVNKDNDTPQESQQQEAPDEGGANPNSIISKRPCGRRSHSAVVHNEQLLLFGGFQENSHRHYNDLWSFDYRTHIEH